jgi:hypothetical protein
MDDSDGSSENQNVDRDVNSKGYDDDVSDRNEKSI